jgi:hypothetical protein
MRCSKKILFDHFVGPYQERFRDLKAKRLRSLEIDRQIELGNCNTGRSEGFAPLRVVAV